MNIKILLLLGSVFAGCSKIRYVVKPADPCLTVPPPIEEPVTVLDPDSACPNEKDKVCLSPSEAQKLMRNLEKLRGYIKEVVARCSVPSPVAPVK